MRPARTTTLPSPLVLMAAAGAAEANAGVPMIIVALPGMLLAFVPVVFVEALVLFRRLWIPWLDSVKCSLVLNGVSTLVGIPLTWLALLALQLVSGGGGAYGPASGWHRLLEVTLQAPWLIPCEQDLPWMIPSGTLVLLLPFFAVSWWLAYQAAARFFREHSRRTIRATVLVANSTSDAGLAGWSASDSP